MQTKEEIKREGAGLRSTAEITAKNGAVSLATPPAETPAKNGADTLVKSHTDSLVVPPAKATVELPAQGTAETPTKALAKKSQKSRLTAKRLALMAVFVALSYAVSLLEIPLPLFGATFLKLDFGNVFILLIAFLLGPVEGVVVCLFKEGLRCLSSSSLCAGELANFLITSSYLLLPAILYRRKRTLKRVIWTLSVSSLVATGVALLANRFLIFPTFAALFGGSIFGMTVTEAFAAFWVAVLLFNLIKTVGVGLLTLLLYKRLSNFLKKLKI